MTSRSGWMIYGAYGYTGVLVAEEAVRRGHRPILAGRSAEKLAPLAARLGLEALAVDLSDTPSLTRALERVQVVFHAAGPFVDTSDAMIRACLEARTSYVDITGEVAVFQNTFTYDAAARDAGIALVSGVGFDVVPTDCMARYLAEKLPGATELEIAIAGLAEVSAGTAKSMFDGMLIGGQARRDGKLVATPTGRDLKRVRFADRERTTMAIPWGDLETAFHTTGIPNITTYVATPGNMAALAHNTWRLQELMAPVTRAVLGAGPIKRAIVGAIERRVSGPDEKARREGGSHVWCRVANASGRSVEGWLETVNGYTFTALAGVRSVEKLLAESAERPAGALTPARAFGADFVLEIEGSRRYDTLPS
ncbi:MAG TPA: saccharopine dehydrogenase NADP-binding domain-containing protein [Polyangiaceae bacterium]|jgi:short subunit dehydrogenase-like uncharacterized protein|nr:saccharopine dehydrogenase NADP-binding domain-containing protein [Polyangiaceae bacterium]